MDIFQFNLEADSEQGSELQLRHPKTGELIPVYITVLGPDSKAARKAQTDLLRLSGTSNDDPELRAAKFAAAVTTGWRNLAEGDKDIPFSREEAIRIYSSPKTFWVREQVERFQANRINFPGASSSD